MRVITPSEGLGARAGRALATVGLLGAAIGTACSGATVAGGSSDPSSTHRGAAGGSGLFAPIARTHASASGTATPAPAACREVTFREIPTSPVPAVSATMGEDTETLATTGGFLVVRSGVGPARAVLWDAGSNAWRDAGPGPATYRPGDVGPMSGGHWLPVGGRAVLVWQNESQRSGLQAALADPAAGTFDLLSLEGGPGTVDLRHADTAGRLVVFEGPGLAGGWRFDPRARVWAPIASEGRPDAADAVVLAALGDRVIVVGTAPASGGSAGALYDPELDRWTLIAGGPTPAPSFVATAQDALFWWGQSSYTEPLRGAIYRRALDAWQLVASEGAPAARPMGTVPVFAFTGTHLVHAEEHAESHALPHDPAAVYDVASGTWSRIPIPPTHGDPYALPDGRVVFFGRSSAQPVVLDPRTGLVCTPDVSAVPTLGTIAATLFAFAGVVGDEIVLWGRTDSGPTRAPCPPGAPCMPSESWSSSRDDGVAVRF